MATDVRYALEAARAGKRHCHCKESSCMNCDRATRAIDALERVQDGIEDLRPVRHADLFPGETLRSI